MLRLIVLSLPLILTAAPHMEAGLKLDVLEHRLPNGLTLLILEHHLAPVVSCSIFYRAGSANGEAGSTGISHFLEHMMFKGTRTVGTRDYEREKALLKKCDRIRAFIAAEEGKGNADSRESTTLRKQLALLRREADSLRVENEFWKILVRNGAVGLNAHTGRDYTHYFCSLPSNRLELWMRLESDRMCNAVFRDFHSEKEVICEERRLGIEDSPQGMFNEQLFATAFIAHPYRWPVIGWKQDIENITLSGLESFYRRAYAPNNAIIAIAGDVRPAEVIKLAHRYFGPIHPRKPLPPVVTTEPPQLGMREARLSLDASPRIALSFHKPSVSDNDDIVLQIIENILSSGRTSRLYKNLVQGRKIAVAASASCLPMKYPSLFILYAVPRQPNTNDAVEEAMWQQIALLREEPPGDWEIGKAKNQIEADFIRELQSTSGIASLLGMYEAIDRWEYLTTYLQRIRAVTVDDVRRVARKYLMEENCTKLAIK